MREPERLREMLDCYSEEKTRIFSWLRKNLEQKLDVDDVKDLDCEFIDVALNIFYLLGNNKEHDYWLRKYLDVKYPLKNSSHK